MLNRLAQAQRRLGKRLARPEPGIPFSAARPFLPAAPVIVEAGAWTGGDVPELLATWPQATVHAFEPEPGSYRKLVRRVGSLPNVRTWNLALGTQDGTATLNVSDNRYGTASSSLLAPGAIQGELPETAFKAVEVRQQTLDSWAAENAVDHIDLFALDMQGFEHAALSASPAALRQASVVITEAFLNEMYEGAATVDELQALLAGAGFVIVQTNIYWGTTHEVMAIRRDVLERAVAEGLDTKRSL